MKNSIPKESREASKLKIKNYITKIKTFTFWIVILLLTFYILHLVPVARSQSPTPEASPAAEETLDEKIQGIREAVKEKVREKLEEVKKGQKRAFVGEINEITDTTLTLVTRRGKKYTDVAEETKIINQNRKEIELKDLEIGNYVIAMGYLKDTDTLDTKRIVIISKPKLPAREVAFGKVIDVSSEEEVLSVKNEKKGITYTVQKTTTTQITKKIEGEIEKVKFNEIEMGGRLVAIGTPSEGEEKIISAKIIHVIPGKAVGLPTEAEVEQPSPTPSSIASPSPAIEEE